MDNQPLAEKHRPTSLVDVVGQKHIIGTGKIISELVSSKQPASLIFWGPPGSGKTTLARIIAKQLEADFIEVSAVTAGLADVRKVIERASQNQRLKLSTVLFVDEIHRFNKAQQDAFLPHVESGLIYLIGATTENPSFEIIRPLLSRSRVVTLQPISKVDMQKLLHTIAKREKLTSRISPKSYELLAEIAGGDARVALGALELATQLTSGKITPEVIKTAAQRRPPSYDKNGEMHYDVISAFIKSLRGSNISASCYYLARMLQAGEDPKFIARRMVILASEDIGIAASPALNLAVSTFEAVERIGMPECQYSLFHCTIVLAGAKKSRMVAEAMSKSLAQAKAYPELAVPLHLRNAPTSLMKDLGYGKDYQWQAGFKHQGGFLPPEIVDFDVTQ